MVEANRQLTDGKKARALEPDEVIDGGLDVVVEPSSTSRFTFRSAARDKRAAGSALRVQVLMYAEKLEEWPAFVRELFCLLYDEDGCKPLEDEEKSLWGVSAMSVLEGNPDWPGLRASAQVSRTIAVEAATTLAVAVAQALRLDQLQTDEETRRDPRALESEGEMIRRLLEEGGATQEQIDAAVAESEAAAAASAAARNGIDSRIDSARQALKAAVKSAATKAADRAEMMSAMSSLGFSREGPGSVEEVCPELLQQASVDKRLLAIIRMVGRFREALHGELAKADGHCDVIGVRPTSDIARLTPRTKGELAAGGIHGLSVMRDILEGAAQGWEQRAQQPKNRGDAAILVDRSGSMSGEREIRARALAIASLVTMLQGGRRALASSFAGTGDVSSALVVPGDTKALGEAIKVLCKRASGGTDVDHALQMAVDAMKLHGGMRDPDVLVITDGYFPTVAKTVLDAMGDRRLFGVMLDESSKHPEFTATWDVSSQSIDEKQAGEILSAMRSTRKKGGL